MDGTLRRLLHCIAFLTGLLLAAGRCGAAQPPGIPIALGPEEGRALIHILRNRITPASRQIESPPPRLSLDQPVPLPLIVTLYHNGRPKWHHASVEGTLRRSATTAAEKLARSFSGVPQRDRLLSEAVIQIDIVVERAALEDARGFLLDRFLAPGLDGVVFTTPRRSVYLTPLVLLRHWHKPDILTAAFTSQEHRTQPSSFRAERFRTVTFAEATPGGRVVSLYRGNVLVPKPHAEQMTRALSYAAIWLLKSQRPDGSFPGPFNPADDSVPPAVGSLADHMRTVPTLVRLHQLLGDPHFRQAADRAIRFAVVAMREDLERQFVYVPAGDDLVSTSALLLTSLCLRALAQETPTADGRMKYLGNFLCVMTSRDGRIFRRIPRSRWRTVPYETRGGPYAEALMALSLLQRVSPSREVGQAADRIADLLVAERRAPPFPVQRTVEALAAYYKVKRLDRYAQAVFSMAEKLAVRQMRNAPYPDFEGGFARPDLPPDISTTASTLCALASAYETARLTGRATEPFCAPVVEGARFIMNMQYRAENSFFLVRSEQCRGAFRGSPEDLRIRLAPNADAMRALILAATITAATVPVEPLDEPRKSSFS